jgi:hypothetical protein
VNKKIGKFKLWQLVAIGAAVGLAFYLYKKREGGVNPEEVVGGTGTGAFGPIDPNTGVPYAFESGLGGKAGSAAGESLDEFLRKVGELREAGFFGTPEKEVIETPGAPGAEPATNKAVATAQKHARMAKAEAKKARKAQHAAKAAQHKAEHQNTQKPKKTGAAASVPHTHVSQAHPVTRTKKVNRKTRR